jgi:alpha-beta hydrolase superfamily lysophospholipase
MATILFLHGWNSKPGGVKPAYLAHHGHTVKNPALPDDDFAASVRIAQAELDRDQAGAQVVVGSSRGGAIAMNIETGSAKLVLLCPAWKKYGSARTVKPGTVILHSEADEVVPIADSRELLARSGLPETALIVVGSDHRLADPEPLAALLAAVEHASRETPGGGMFENRDDA